MAYVTISGREDIEQREEKSGNTVYVFRRKIVTTYARQLSVNASFTPATPTQIYGSVSIHAPRAGRDLFDLGQYFPIPGFNPRAPRGARPLISIPLAWMSQVV